MPSDPVGEPASLPSTERGRRSRAAIVNAAATMMYQRGVGSTSLDEVLAAANCGKSQLYHYFHDKSDLVRAVISRQLQLILESQPAIEQVDSWAGLRRWAEQVLDAESVPGGPFACPLGTIAAELKNDEAYRPALAAAFRQWEDPLRRGLEKMLARGQLSPRSDPARLARSVIAALQGGMLMARVHDDPVILHDAVDGAVKMLRACASRSSRRRTS